MPIVRKSDVAAATSKPSFTVGINITLTGSKKLTAEQQEKMMSIEKVHILITAADDPSNVLVDAEAAAREFSTGSVGYGLNLREAQFSK